MLRVVDSLSPNPPNRKTWILNPETKDLKLCRALGKLWALGRLWNCWKCWTSWISEIAESAEFVELLNCWICWICELLNLLNCRSCWMVWIAETAGIAQNLRWSCRIHPAQPSKHHVRGCFWMLFKAFRFQGVNVFWGLWLKTHHS